MTYYNEIIKTSPLLNQEEEKQLADTIKNGEGKSKQQAREKLFNANVRLVIKFANKASSNYNIPVEDLLSDGSIGLMAAIDRFDPWKFKNKFSTYACEYVKLHINKAIEKAYSKVHVPQNVLLKTKRYEKIVEDDPDISNDELTKQLDITPNALRKIKTHSENSVVSMSAQVNSIKNDTSKLTLQDCIKDESAPDPSYEAIKGDEKAMLMTVVDSLNTMQKDIIYKRFFSEDTPTLSCVAKEYGLSKERIRQVQDEALAIMKKRINSRRKYGDS